MLPSYDYFVALYDALPFLTRLNAEAGLINGVAYAPGGIAVFRGLVYTVLSRHCIGC